MRLAFFGAPGGGKGTQAKRVLADAKAVQISTGDLLRDAKEKGTPLGLRAKEFMDKGALVPDDLVNSMLRDRLVQKDAREGFILDGYPRTVAQLQSLEALLADLKMPMDKWLFIDVPLDAIEDRVLNRRTCKKCGEMYNLKFSPPKNPGICDKCGGELYQRSDDSSEKLATRFAAYRNDTIPVMDNLRRRKLLTEVQAGTKKPDEVEVLVRKALGLKAK
jgi:adenylate kinase